jgi:hypothetical protein
MAQEFTIKSEAIESKINQLLPTQGGFQPGVDFSASTMIMPIVDLTETAEGSALRQDLQSSFSFNSVTHTATITATTDTLVSTTGYYRVFGTSSNGSASQTNSILIDDGIATKNVFVHRINTGGAANNLNFDFIVLLTAGDSLKQTVSNANNCLLTTTRQIADLSGNLISPS